MNLSSDEENTLKLIIVASENDPLKPEFPADNPKFPATPTYKIDVPGFSDVWIKDESFNPTGTHKDRMAWEIIVTYRNFLLAKKNGQTKGPLPAMSIISSGSAAIAIQTLLRKYNLPNLKVLIDPKSELTNLPLMKRLGCEVYETDLAKKALHWKEILKLTHNPEGFDITSSEALDPSTRFYDWLSYEIINSSPDYCFIPFGTGNLFENILNVNKNEISSATHDPRFKGNVEKLRHCSFMAATTDDPDSKAEKLYSPHLPFVHYNEQWMRLYKHAGFCGPESNVYVLEERFLDKAIQLADKLNISAEPSGIAGLALLLQLKPKLPSDKKMLIVNTGKTKVVK